MMKICCVFENKCHCCIGYKIKTEWGKGYALTCAIEVRVLPDVSTLVLLVSPAWQEGMCHSGRRLQTGNTNRAPLSLRPLQSVLFIGAQHCGNKDRKPLTFITNQSSFPQRAFTVWISALVYTHDSCSGATTKPRHRTDGNSHTCQNSPCLHDGYDNMTGWGV